MTAHERPAVESDRPDPAPRRAVIAIHGVGNPAPGSTVGAIAAVVSQQHCVEFARDSVVVGSHEFVRLVPSAAHCPDLYEVNWSDVRRPAPSLSGVVQHLLQLTFGLPEVRFGWMTFAPVSRIARGYSWLIQTSFAWVLFPVLLGLIHYSLNGVSDDRANSRMEAIVCEVLLLFAALVSVVRLQRLTRAICISGWVLVGVLIAMTIVLWWLPGSVEPLVIIAVRLYGAVQIVAAGLIMLVGCELALGAVGRRPRRQWPALAQLACCYVPLVLVSIVGATLWAVVLNVLQQFGLDDAGSRRRFATWQKLFLENLGYDLAAVEWTMAAAVGGLTLLLLAGAACYWRAPAESKGTTAHRWVGILLWAAPLVLAVPGVVLFMTCLGIRDDLFDWPGSQNVLTVYTYSALRIAPWLLLLLTPFSVVLDVMGDVGLYIIHPRQRRLTTRLDCQARLKTLLNRLRSSGKYDEITVVGHSQGSVIAYDVLRGLGPQPRPSGALRLVTMGSPLRSLYRKYLKWPLAPIEAAPNWVNIYRTGDYIGGPVGLEEVTDQPIGSGGHVNYWSDAAAVRHFV